MPVPHRIGVVGYSGQKFDESKARAILREALFKRYLEHLECAVVTGLTDLGIPALAYREADKLGMILVGIACKKAMDYKCYDVHKKIIVGDDWGDESETFLANIDELLKVGGGKQSIAEFAKFTGPKEEFELETLS